MKKLLVILLGLLLLCGCSDNSAYVGEYYDTYSQRATMKVESNGSKLNVTVHWPDSYISYVEWTMTCKVKDNKLVYDEYKKTYAEIDEDSIQEDGSYKIKDDCPFDVGGQGYFEIVDGSLCWTGSDNEYEQECVFVKVEQ